MAAYLARARRCHHHRRATPTALSSPRRLELHVAPNLENNTSTKLNGGQQL